MIAMKYVGLCTALFLSVSFTSLIAQEEELSNEDQLSYYEKRAMEDAEYEQSLTMANEEDEADFWNDQKQYEKDLKKRDRKAYKAYMKGKQDAYAEHARYCDNHCHHSGQYHYHASFYYSHYRYDHPPRRSVRTGVRIGTPSVRLGIF